MTIREVSEKCGVTADTLRYYEKAGLIPPIKRKENGIRDYTEEDLRWVELSRCMRASGLSIEAIVEYVRLFREGDATIPARLELLLGQRKTLLEKRQKIDDALMWLDKKIDRYENAVATGVLHWNQE